MNFEKNIRVTRNISVAHSEAFQLMHYRARNATREGVWQPFIWIWNSRDGVTPFVTFIDGVEYQHSMNQYQPRYLSMLPEWATHVWVSHTPQTWEEMQRRTYEKYSKVHYETSVDFIEDYPTAEDWLRANPFEHGQPHLLTRAEYLETTSEWMGNYK